jgi:DNA-binding transcriptional MocR family regulator
VGKSIPIHIDRRTNVPLYSQIAQALTEYIQSGRLAPGEKLPAIRSLARALQVNTVTVVKAYQELERAGLAVSRAGSGTYVAPHDQASAFLSAAEPELDLLDRGQVEIPPGAINFASATPDPDLLPVATVQRLINRVIERDGGQVFAYEESRGYLPLREKVADVLAALGIHTEPTAIQVMSGGQQGIDVVAKSLLKPGDIVLVETPTYPGALAAFRSRGARIVSVPLGEDGPDLAALKDILKRTRPRFFYLMPAFQNPTGTVYSRQKKEELLNLAARFRLTLLEDDYLSELSFADVDLTPLAALAPPEVPVLYLKSFSKVFLPGFRLAFLAVPPLLRREILAAKHTSDIFTSGLFQRVFDLFLREGIWEEQLARIRRLYEERYHTMVQALEKELPAQVAFTPPRGGLNFWLRLPGNLDAALLYREALRAGVVISPGALFLPTPGPSSYFRLTYASLGPEEIRRGAALLGNACRRVLGERCPGEYAPFV